MSIGRIHGKVSEGEVCMAQNVDLWTTHMFSIACGRRHFRTSGQETATLFTTLESGLDNYKVFH